MATINGEYRRMRKSARKGVRNGAVELDTPAQKLSGLSDVFSNPESLGAQAWEYLNQDQVQAENVAITGTNDPNAMANNTFYQMEQTAAGGADAAAAAAQATLNAAKSAVSTTLPYLLIGAVVLLFVLPMLEGHGGE